MGHWPPRQDPGPCPICGTASCGCTSPGYDQIAIPQLPHRDALVEQQRQDAGGESVEVIVTTKTYRGDPKRKPRR